MEAHVTERSTRVTATGFAGSPSRLAGELREALGEQDLDRVRRLVARSLAAGRTPGQLYVDVIRPALQTAERDARLAGGPLLAEARDMLRGDLVAALPTASSVGPGRAALLSCRPTGLERLDGELATDFLAADGWAVQRLDGAESALSLGPAARPDSVELAVAVVASPEDARRLAPACTLLRRLPDPPVVMLCDFSGRADWPTASAGLGADAFVSDPQELMLQAALRLPADGVRRWGVQISRRGDALVLTPTGRLDVASAARLADVVRSRLGTFAHVIIDLRDLAEFSSGGLQGVRGWSDGGPLGGVVFRLIGDPAVRSRIAALGTHGDLTLEDAVPV